MENYFPKLRYVHIEKNDIKDYAQNKFLDKKDEFKYIYTENRYIENVEFIFPDTKIVLHDSESISPLVHNHDYTNYHKISKDYDPNFFSPNNLTILRQKYLVFLQGLQQDQVEDNPLNTIYDFAEIDRVIDPTNFTFFRKKSISTLITYLHVYFNNSLILYNNTLLAYTKKHTWVFFSMKSLEKYLHFFFKQNNLFDNYHHELPKIKIYLLNEFRVVNKMDLFNIQFNNGIFNPITKLLTQNNKNKDEVLFSNLNQNYAYEQNVPPIFMHVMGLICPDLRDLDGFIEKIRTLYYFALIGEISRYQKSLHIIGVPGAGKSFIVNYLGLLLGMDSCLFTKIENLDSQDSINSGLGLKRLLVIQELPERLTGSLTGFRGIVGGETIKTRKLYSEAVDECFPGLCILTSNTVPYYTQLKHSSSLSAIERRKIYLFVTEKREINSIKTNISDILYQKKDKYMLGFAGFAVQEVYSLRNWVLSLKHDSAENLMEKDNGLRFHTDSEIASLKNDFLPKKSSNSSNSGSLNGFEASLFQLFESCITFNDVSTEYYSIDEIKAFLLYSSTIDSLISDSDKVLLESLNNKKFSYYLDLFLKSRYSLTLVKKKYTSHHVKYVGLSLTNSKGTMS